MGVVIPDGDKARARHHLGYPGVDSGASFALGVPTNIQTNFMIEGALNRVLPAHLPKFNQLLEQLDCIECKIADTDLSDVNAIGEVDVNRRRLVEIAQQYCHFRSALANLLLVPPNPFDQRGLVAAGGGGMNAPVAH